MRRTRTRRFTRRKGEPRMGAAETPAALARFMLERFIPAPLVVEGADHESLP